MERVDRSPRWKTLPAFAIVYFVRRSTFYAIRVGVYQAPPLIFAALRFLPAGAVLVGWTLVRGEKLPAAREWSSVFAIAFPIFVVDYGLLFRAEQRVPSGPAAVMIRHRTCQLSRKWFGVPSASSWTHAPLPVRVFCRLLAYRGHRQGVQL